MLIDGCYIAWFKTKLGQGTGRVLLENGKISGGDNGDHLQWIVPSRGHAIYGGA